MLRLVFDELDVALLCTPLEEFVAFDLMVNVLFSTFRPSSYADFLAFKDGLSLPIPIEDGGLGAYGEFFGGGCGGSSTASSTTLPFCSCICLNLDSIRCT